MGNASKRLIFALSASIAATLMGCNGGGSAPAAPTNRGPAISGTPPTTVVERAIFSFTPSASDPDGDALTFSVSNAPAWASFDTASGTLTGRPTSADVGTTSGIAISVSDGTASAALAPFDLTVNVLKAFPSAEGFGTDTVHGRDGRVVFVTNLDDAGPGSLRQALEIETGPRIVVFRTGGTIRLLSNITIREANSFVYIAGQTAPGGGIQLRDAGILLQDAHDVVLRHLRIRPGLLPRHLTDGLTSQDALSLLGTIGGQTYNVVADHCTFMWAPDENVGSWLNVHDVTLQWSIVAEGNGPGPTGVFGGPTPGDGGYAVLFGADGNTIKTTMSLHHTLLAHHDDRHPAFIFVNPQVTPAATADVRNNLIYNWNGSAARVNLEGIYDNAQAVEANFVNNQFLAGPSHIGSWSDTPIWIINEARIHATGNWGPLCPSGCPSNEWDSTVLRFTAAQSFHPASANVYQAPDAFSVPTVTTLPTAQVFDAVLAGAGATQPQRDAVDLRIVQETRDGTGVYGPGSDGSYDFPVLDTGTPYVDADQDGVDDTWESLHGLDPSDATDAGGVSPNGFTFIENFVNELAGDTIPSF